LIASVPTASLTAAEIRCRVSSRMMKGASGSFGVHVAKKTRQARQQQTHRNQAL
jgi:hypothetical protein